MEWFDIERRIEKGEDQQTEFKRGLGDLSARRQGDLRLCQLGWRVDRPRRR